MPQPSGEESIEWQDEASELVRASFSLPAGKFA